MKQGSPAKTKDNLRDIHERGLQSIVSMSNLIYKLLLAYEWEVFEQTGVFLGTPLDFADGYIHLSSADQVVETARLHFKNLGPLVLAEFDAAVFGDQLIYEPSRGGQMFPHLFGRLKLSQVRRHWDLRDPGEGAYSFPPEFK